MRMNMCPLCNGFSVAHYVCSVCGNEERDIGRLADYLDDYSAYVDIEVANAVIERINAQQCIHLFYCDACERDEIRSITE